MKLSERIARDVLAPYASRRKDAAQAASIADDLLEALIVARDFIENSGERTGPEDIVIERAHKMMEE